MIHNIEHSRDVDEFLASRLMVLRRIYRTGISPQDTHAAAVSLWREIQGAKGIDASVQAARLQVLMADVLLAAGTDRKSLLEASIHSRYGIQIINGVPAVGREKIKLFVHASLLESIAYKATGNIDQAFRSLKSAQSAATSSNANLVELVPLIRQEALLLQSKEAFLELARTAWVYRNYDPVEYYATIKRVFEFLVNKGQLQSANSIFREFRNAYLCASPQLTPLAQVSFIKNLGHYYALNRKRLQATRILLRALYAAEKMQLHGQQRQLIRLLSEIERGSGVLQSFQV